MDEQKQITIKFNKKSLIAAILNFILVGLGYLYLKYYKKALIMFLVYLFLALLLAYVATFIAPLIWLGLLLNLGFAYHAYKLGMSKQDGIKQLKNIELEKT